MLQKKLTVSYLGPPGTFSQIALQQIAKTNSVQITEIPCSDAAGCLNLVANQTATYACLPIENSLAGSVDDTLDELIYSDEYQIFLETSLMVDFCIASKTATPTNIKDITAVPIAWNQVKNQILQHFPQVVSYPALSNSAAADAVANHKYSACVTTELAARQRNLNILFSNIIGAERSKTRFVLIGLTNPVFTKTGVDKTALIFELNNTTGQLAKILTEFAIRDINLARIESRPTKKSLGTYRFLVEIYGHIQDDLIKESLLAVHRKANQTVFLGSWPTFNSTEYSLPTYKTGLVWLRKFFNKK